MYIFKDTKQIKDTARRRRSGIDMIAPTRTRSIAGPEHPVNPQVLTEKIFWGGGFNPFSSITLEHLFYIS